MVNGISVVIPNFNGADLFGHTLPTVKQALDNTGLPWELIVADDCSTDDSVGLLSRAYPYVSIVRNAINSGFSVTANKGVAAAAHDKVLLLNSDVQLTPGYFRHQLHYFDDPRVFGVMGRIVGWDDDIIQDGAKYPSFHGVKIKTTGNYLLCDEKAMGNGIYSMYLSGANAFFDKKIFLELGGMNTLFSPFYSEDFELSLRAWRLGYLCFYDHQSICRHKVSHTIKSSSRKKYVDMIYDRNKMYVHAIHLSGMKKLLWFLQLVPETLIRIVTGRWHYLRSLKQFLSSRRQVADSVSGFKKLAETKGINLSVGEVSTFIRNHIKGDIRRF